MEADDQSPRERSAETTALAVDAIRRNASGEQPAMRKDPVGPPDR